MIGMHRSGTSALSGLLEGLGLDAGNPEAMMSSDSGNPEGYYEQRPIVDLNEEILVAHGGRWDSPPLWGAGWASELDADRYIARAEALLAASFSGRHFVLKDPRVSLVLPLWRKALLDRGCAVVIVRDPSEVAWSLALRDSIPSLTGFALWSAYNRAALDGLSGMPVHVCSYGDLVERPREVVGEIVASLQSWGEVPPGADLERAVARVKPDLRRNTRPSDDREAVVTPEEIAGLTAHLSSLRGRHDAFDQGDTPARGWWEEPLLNERRLILQRSAVRIHELEAVCGELEHDNEALRAQSNELREELATTSAALHRLRSTLPVRLWHALRGTGVG